MTIEDSKIFCYNLAKAFSTAVRLYKGDEFIYYYSLYAINPDPLQPYLKEILTSNHSAGLIVTPFYQFYGFIFMPNNYQIILGPTRILQDNFKEMQELLFMLGVSQNKKTEYEQLLYSAPLISIERFTWLLAALGTALFKKEFPVENVWVQIRPESSLKEIKKSYIQKQINSNHDTNILQSIQQSYIWELLISSYIKEGQPELLRDLFSSPPKIEAGIMSDNTLRQNKNAGICATTIAARTAIKGKMEISDAFHMSDLYIQKLEFLKDSLSIEKLVQEMLIDYAEKVEAIKLNTYSQSRIFNLCAQYISQNIFSTIRAEEIANHLGYTRAYLCNQFKITAGISLTQYILKEKVLEAKRMLQFTDKNLSEISALFGFSSQSHFQTVFKKITQETPLSYRKRTAIL